MALFPLKRVDALVAGSIATHIGAVLAVLVGFDVLQALYKEFMDIGDGDYTALGAIVHVAYTVPRRIHTLFIIAAVIGTLMGLGMLAGNGELTGLRAAGLSKRRIALSATGAVGGLALAVFLMGETLAPEGERWAQTMAVQAKHRDYAVSGIGMWARDGETVMNAKSVLVIDGQLQMRDVRLFRLAPDGRLAGITRAAQAMHRDGAWQLRGVRRYDLEDGRVVAREAEVETWQSSLDPDVVSQGAIRPHYQGMRALWEQYRFLSANQLNTQAVESAFWQRGFMPLTTLALVFAVTPFAFGALRSGGLGKRLFLGIVIAVSFYFLQRALVDMANAYDHSLPLVNALPVILLAGAGLWYYRRYA